MSCRANSRSFWTVYGLPLVISGALLSSPLTAYGQRTRRDGGEGVVTRTSKDFLKAFREVVAKSVRSTVRIRCDDELAAFGVIVGADGWVLTKASELKGKIVCELHDGKELVAKITGVSEAYDLAMLKLDAKALSPVEWRDSKEDAVGSWVATPGMNEAPVAVGVISVAARGISGSELARRGASGGFLGVRVEAAKVGVKIVQVISGRAAARAGFEEDDVILAIDDKKIANPEALFKMLGKTKPGERIRVRLKRGEEEIELSARLGGRPLERGEFQNQLGGKLSDHRTGFPMVLQHDTVLRPVDCGGPLVDLDGKVIGINIARSGRTETLAIPAETIKTLLDDLKSGKLAPK